MRPTPFRVLPFSPEELDALVAAAPCLWWRAFIDLSGSTGLRAQEALRLHTSDVCEQTLSVRITSDPPDAFGGPEELTLRRRLPVHQERIVPAPPNVIGTLTRLRSERPEDSHVFVPDWKLDQLWLRLVSHSQVTTDHLCPGIAAHFRMIQRRARLVLARRSARPLSALEWRDRPIGSLRITAAVRLAEELSPHELAERLGCAGVRAVARFYSLHVVAKRGVA